MKKIIMLLLPVLFIVGCSTDKPSEVEDKNDPEENVEMNEETLTKAEEIEEKAESDSNREEKNEATNSEITDTINDKGTKPEYLQKLEEVESSLSALEETVKNGNQSEMNHAQDEIFKIWDAALNEIYAKLEEHLSKEEMNVLRMEQRKWIEDRDVAAEAAAEEYKGGSLAPFAYSSSLTDWTKERSYELVENYMD